MRISVLRWSAEGNGGEADAHQRPQRGASVMEERSRGLCRDRRSNQSLKKKNENQEIESGRRRLRIGDTSVSRSEEEIEEMVGEDGGGTNSVAGSSIWVCDVSCFLVLVEEEEEE